MLALEVASLALVLVGLHGVAAISGGVKSDIKLHPYQVAVDWVTAVEDDGEVYDYESALICGGALLTPSTVLTAASCLAKKGSDYLSSTKVRVGSQLREEGGENYGVVGAVVHPSYESFSGGFDLMLLYLDGEAPLRSEVQTVPLVEASVSLKAGDTLYVSGYGDLNVTTQDEPGQLELQALAFPVFNLDICMEVLNLYYDDAPRGCAASPGAGLCGSRDVGSPFVDWLGRLVGVASRQLATGCGRPGEPALFTSLADASVNKWVRDNADGPAAASGGVAGPKH